MSAAIVNKDAATVEGRSVLPIEWTPQHGAGGDEDTNPNKMNAHFVIQYLAQPFTGKGSPWDAGNPPRSMLRDGVNTNRNNYQQPQRKLSGSQIILASYI